MGCSGFIGEDGAGYLRGGELFVLSVILFKRYRLDFIVLYRMLLLVYFELVVYSQMSD